MGLQDNAVKLHGGSYNCAQCVLKSCGDFYPHIDQNILSAVAAGFGMGVNCKEICGALTGAVMAIGLAAGFDDTDPRTVLASKNRVIELTNLCTEDFNKKFGSRLCSALRGGEHSCNELIAYGAELAARIISNNILIGEK